MTNLVQLVDNRKTKKVNLPSFNYYKTEGEKSEIIQDLKLAEGNKNIIKENGKPKVFNDTEIVMFSELNTKNNAELAQEAVGKTEYDIMLLTIIKSIDTWNFSGAEGKLLPITIKNLYMLPQGDINSLIVALTGKTLQELAETGLDKKKG